ncbi:hypothetical protein ACJX0J_013407, partial [Zea mays]
FTSTPFQLLLIQKVIYIKLLLHIVVLEALLLPPLFGAAILLDAGVSNAWSLSVASTTSNDSRPNIITNDDNKTLTLTKRYSIILLLCYIYISSILTNLLLDFFSHFDMFFNEVPHGGDQIMEDINYMFAPEWQPDP